MTMDNGILMGYYYMINWNVYLVGGIPTHPSIGMRTSPIYGKIYNVPNHQPVYDAI